MKTLLLFTLFLSFSIGLSAQSKVTASIDRNCNSVPAKINIANGNTASNFSMGTLQAGKNCYNGSQFQDKGFVIKNASGNIVYKYQMNSKGEVYAPNGQLNQLTLSPGIYYVHVDGGNGARLELNFYIK